jgi:hypothetical protein
MCRTAHSVYGLQYHVVWVCKYHCRISNTGVCDYFRKVLPKLLPNAGTLDVEPLIFKVAQVFYELNTLDQHMTGAGLNVKNT